MPQQPTQEFHDMESSCDWPKELRELHAIAREQYGTYLRLDYQEVAARRYGISREVNDGPEAGKAEHAHVAAYQCLASHAYALLKRINERGAALVAQWDAENAVEAAFMAEGAAEEPAPRLIIGEISDDGGETWRPMTADERRQAEDEYRRDHAPIQPADFFDNPDKVRRAVERQQRANAASIADGGPVLHPSEY